MTFVMGDRGRFEWADGAGQDQKPLFHTGLHLSLRCLDCRGEGVDVVGAVLAAAVDEESGGAGHSAGGGRVDVFGDARSAHMTAQILAEPVDV